MKNRLLSPPNVKKEQPEHPTRLTFMPEDYSGLIYLPPPQKPFDFDEKWKRIVGINTDTGLPFLRVVWGMDRKKWVGGVEEVWYIDPNGIYIGMPYLIVEVWNPPTIYDRKEWEALRYDGLADNLGPFPEKGVWDLLKILRKGAFDIEGKMSATEAAEPAGWEMAYRVGREWRYNATRTEARKRAISEHLRFQDAQKALKASAMNTLRERRKAELAWALAKDEALAEFSFSTTFTEKELREKDRNNDGNNDRNNGGAMPVDGFERTPAGLFVKKDAVINSGN